MMYEIHFNRTIGTDYPIANQNENISVTSWHHIWVYIGIRVDDLVSCFLLDGQGAVRWAIL